jgi:hypothetical protein
VLTRMPVMLETFEVSEDGEDAETSKNAVRGGRGRLQAQ